LTLVLAVRGVAGQPIKPARPPVDDGTVDRRSLLAGVLVSLPFTLSVALLCTTSAADAFYARLAAGAMLALYAVLMAVQVACGVRAFRGAPLIRPLASVSASYMAGAFAVLLLADAVVRLSGVKGAALPLGVGGTAAEWAGILLSLASVPVMSGLVVIVGVLAARDRLRTR
jgi:hypothetical protein